MISERLRAAREGLGLSLEELGQRVGLPAGRVERLESGPPEATPLPTYARVCAALGVELPELCTLRALHDPTAFAEGVALLRERLEIGRDELAAKAGVERARLARLEGGAADAEAGALIVRLGAALGIAAADLCHVIFDSPRGARRFHAFNVGIGKSGTMSLAWIFSAYASWHEFLSEPTLRRVFARRDGELDDDAFDEFLLWRDRLGNLELDSAGYHANFIERLVALFPEARFIITLRDCYSWLDSFLNAMVNDVPAWPDWHFDGVYRGNFDVTREMLADRALLLGALPERLDRLVAAWAEPNRRVLEAVPRERLLVVPTAEIGASLPAVAQFIGVAPSTLDAATSRSNVRAASQRHDLLRDLDAEQVEHSVERVGGDVMRALYPGYSLEGFLAGTQGRLPRGAAADASDGGDGSPR